MIQEAAASQPAAVDESECEEARNEENQSDQIWRNFATLEKF